MPDPGGRGPELSPYLREQAPAFGLKLLDWTGLRLHWAGTHHEGTGVGPKIHVGVGSKDRRAPWRGQTLGFDGDDRAGQPFSDLQKAKNALACEVESITDDQQCSDDPRPRHRDGVHVVPIPNHDFTHSPGIEHPPRVDRQTPGRLKARFVGRNQLG